MRHNYVWFFQHPSWKWTKNHSPAYSWLEQDITGAHRPCYYIVLWINHFPFVRQPLPTQLQVLNAGPPTPHRQLICANISNMRKSVDNEWKTLVRWNIRLNSDFDSAYFSHFFFISLSLLSEWTFFVAVVFFYRMFSSIAHSLSLCPKHPKSISQQRMGGWLVAGDGEHHCGTKNVNLIFFAMTANEASAAA